MAHTHLIGLLLGTEEDWPTAFEHLLGKVGPISYGGETHELTSERITNEPFDLRSRPRYRLVIDRLGWWYTVPREWLKKISLMDDVYLLNNPFTFQAMEKHSAYCAMMRLGLRVPETWLIPHKNPPANDRFQPTAERYNLPFDLGEIADRIGFPLYMKPFDGGQWVGVTRIRDRDELHAVYDASGERLMHLQAAVEDFDVFARSLSIGAETMVMHFEPDRPMHDRYQVDHDFLSPDARRRGGDDQQARQRLLPLGVQLVRDDHQGRARVPDRLCERLAGRRAHEPPLLLPVGDPRARPLERVLHGHRTADADQPVDARLLRGRRPRRPLLRGEARRLSRPRRRVLPDRGVRGLLRRASPPPRGGAARVRRRARVRPAARATPCSRPSRRTSTSSSPSTSAASSRPGRGTASPEA